MPSETGPDLAEYRARRDFGATPEPPADAPAAPLGGRFVVQRHDARGLHHDLRIESDGVLVSWAVPKGVPLREGVRRLAVRTEDHPLAYLDFEGVIPEGQYGAGRMSVWDGGRYAVEARAEGEWKLVLEGRILRGHYHLVRTGEGPREQWLLFRSDRGPAGPPDPAPAYRRLRPMLASPHEEPFDDDDWSFEIKWDGHRALALVTPELTELRGRAGGELTRARSGLGDLRRLLMTQEAVLDGELVVLGADGAADFGALQAGDGPVVFVAFDLLHADGRWLCDLPLRERRALLAEAVAPEASPRLILSDHVIGRGRDLFAAARARGLEGVVAKRLDAPYRPGRRSPDWRKLKWRREREALICGYTEGTGARRGGIGALILAEAGPEGRLTYLSHVGSGIGDALSRRLRRRLDALADGAAAPEGLPPPAPGQGPARWARPELRCEVAYAEITRDGRLRAPVFRRLIDGDDTTGERPPAPPGPFGDAAGDRAVEEGGRRITLTNLDKTFWPREGIAKGHLIDHYLRVAPLLVPHLAGRPMVLKRYPDGIEGEPFFQHDVAEAPPWLRRAELSRGGHPGERTRRYAVVDDPLALLWLVNLGCIDLNPWQSTADAPDRPTHVLFDLDPSDGVPFARVAETALLVRDALDALGLRGHPRTSGATGMHVMVPLLPGPDFAEVKRFARVVGEGLARLRPDLVTTRTAIAERGPRVFIDANQNGRGRSIASVYSVRPRPGAPVATPLDWDEVGPDLDPGDFTVATLARRIAAVGDLAAPLAEDRQDLASALARLR